MVKTKERRGEGIIEILGLHYRLPADKQNPWIPNEGKKVTFGEGGERREGDGETRQGGR
jgi:hypothetical protein